MSPLVWLGFLLFLEPAVAKRGKLKVKSTAVDPRASQTKNELEAKGTPNSDNEIFCMKNVYLENGKFKEVPKLQEFSSAKCSCTIAIQCKDPKDPHCRQIKHLEFDCLKQIPPVVYNQTNAMLRIKYDPSEKCDHRQRVLNPVCASTSQENLMDNFSEHVKELLRRGYERNKDSPKYLQLFRTQVRIWEAGIYALVYRHEGDLNKLTHDREKLIWVPLAVGFLLIAVSTGLFIYFAIVHGRKTSNESAASRQE